MSRNKSWVKVEGVKNLLAKKIVDFSIFNYGIHIPKEYEDKFLSVIPNNNIKVSEAEKVTLIFDDKQFQVDLRNINSKNRGNTLQLRYDGNKELIDYLKEKYKISYNYIIEHKDKNSKKPVDIPTESQEYMEFYKTDKPNTYKVKLITKNILLNNEVSQININEISIKQRFFDYIGAKDTLGNLYQKSYKLVLLLALLDEADEEGKAVYNDVCSKMIDIYKERSNKGLPVENIDSDIQSNMNALNVNIVKRVMNENAYKVINSKGYIFKDNFEEIEYLCFNKELWHELSDSDKENLKEILLNKLALYYSERVDKINTEFYDHSEDESMEDDEKNIVEEDLEKPDNTLVAIDFIYDYISSKGFNYDRSVIKDFYLVLKTKPFTILSGISGTGKSKLAELFAEAIGANSDNGRFNLIPVRPDWSDCSELIGFRNIHSKFQPGILTNIAKEAADNLDKPYFICLDEMNLARVEYYFSDVLSIMESRKFDKNENIIKTERLIKNELFGDDKEARKKYGDVYIPQNLYIIGTVNMDETTFSFSRKVLDRANTLEFNNVKLDFDFKKFIEDRDKREQENVSTDNDPKNYHNDFLCSKYTKLIDCIEENADEHCIIGKKVIDELIEINNILEKVNLHFGYRVRDEIVFYGIYALDENIMEFDAALDNCIKQKILSRIQGSTSDVQDMLIKLFAYLSEYKEKDFFADYIDDDILNKAEKYLEEDKTDNNKIKYPISCKKLLKMIRRFTKDGFTTFWE